MLSSCLLLLGSCGTHSLEDEIRITREEIADLKRRLPPEAPLYPVEFDRYLEDYTSSIPDFIHDHLIMKLTATQDEDISAAIEGDFDYLRCHQNSSAFRGKFWKVRGTLSVVTVEHLSDRPGGIDRITSGVLFSSQDQPALFHIVTKADILYPKQDTIEFEGIFLKWVRYLSKSGRIVDAPFFMTRRLRKYT